MMNKGLEVIEAHWLFGVAARARSRSWSIRRASIHSLVEYVDGSVLAQLGNPDMRTPIAHALAYPGAHRCRCRRRSTCPALARLISRRRTTSAFPACGSPMRPCGAGGTAPAILNAANEVAVEAFLAGRIAFHRHRRDLRGGAAPVAGAPGRRARRRAGCRRRGARSRGRPRTARGGARRNAVARRELSGRTPWTSLQDPCVPRVLGVLVVFHELGHYLVARWCGVKVLRFSVGFGRVVWSRRIGATEPSGRSRRSRSAAT